MKTPRWLGEFHRQWFAVRKRRTDTAARAFRRGWQDLLDDAGIQNAEDRKAAFREAEALEREQRVQFVGPRRENHSGLKLVLTVEQEAWLHGLFGTQTGADAQQQSLEVVQRFAAQPHRLLAETWLSFVERLREAVASARVLGPFSWLEPARMDDLLSQLFALTTREWPHGTLIRDASTTLFKDSKRLENQQSFVERALSLLFERDTPLEALGIQTANSVLHFSGPLTLHFEDGSTHESDRLRFESTLSLAELMRATHLTTTAKRLLTVENRKTTFLQLARADAMRDTLIIATSFPTQAVRLVLGRLPLELPHYHFGDTDPSGWDILRSLREVTTRPVQPFLMQWRAGGAASVLSARDKQVLARLLHDAQMRDCHVPLQKMQHADTRGDFEQESLGSPSIRGWPFYEFIEITSQGGEPGALLSQGTSFFDTAVP